MGSSESRPENVTYTFDTSDGCITVNAKASRQPTSEKDKEVFKLNNNDALLEIMLRNKYDKDKSKYFILWWYVTTVLYPVNARILRQNQKLVTVKSVELINKSNKTGEYVWKVDRTVTAKETVKRSWYAETNFNSRLEFGYKILTLGTVNFTRKTTESDVFEQSKYSRLSFQNQVRLDLPPRKSVHVELQAVLKTVDIEVEYEASLAGYLPLFFRDQPGELWHNNCNHSDTVQLEDLLPKLGYQRTVKYKEIITVEYYTSADEITTRSFDLA